MAVAGAVVVGGGGGGGIPGVNGQTLTCPTSIAKPANFLGKLIAVLLGSK